MRSVHSRPRSLLILALTVAAALSSVVALTAGPASAAAAPKAAVAVNAVAAAQNAPAAAGPPNTAHPYTVPGYFPLRNPATVSCVYDNCPGGYHGHWAINFLGHFGDPIYAAGGGVFHIGAVSPSCTQNPVTQGTWVWIDHGAGGVTRYMHLDTIIAKEGQLVTPGTEIGTMGASGNHVCSVAYLDMEWRADRLSGTREPIPAMTACEGSTAVSFPKALGYTSWNSMPYNQIVTPTLTNNCLPSVWDLTPDRPTITVTKTGAGVLLVSPSAHTGVDSIRVWIAEYHPSIGRYDDPVTYRTIPGVQSGTHFTGLDIGRTYRFSAALHNTAGWSAWAPTLTTVASGPPVSPRISSVHAGSNYITLSWYTASVAGGGTASYEVARRCVINGAYVSWVYTMVGTPRTYKWYPVRGNTSCQVTVRGHNALGWGPWSVRESVHT
jgi:hypothetical protein